MARNRSNIVKKGNRDVQQKWISAMNNILRDTKFSKEFVEAHEDDRSVNNLKYISMTSCITSGKNTKADAAYQNGIESHYENPQRNVKESTKFSPTKSLNKKCKEERSKKFETICKPTLSFNEHSHDSSLNSNPILNVPGEASEQDELCNEKQPRSTLESLSSITLDTEEKTAHECRHSPNSKQFSAENVPDNRKRSISESVRKTIPSRNSLTRDKISSNKNKGHGVNKTNIYSSKQ